MGSLRGSGVTLDSCDLAQRKPMPIAPSQSAARPLVHWFGSRLSSKTRAHRYSGMFSEPAHSPILGVQCLVPVHSLTPRNRSGTFDASVVNSFSVGNLFPDQRQNWSAAC